MKKAFTLGTGGGKPVPKVRPDLSGAKLIRADLHGRDLSRADLSSANLIGTDLRGGLLNGAHLNGANLTRSLCPEIPGGPADVRRRGVATPSPGPPLIGCRHG